MKCSTCRGTLTGKREVYKEITDTQGNVEEVFYLTDLIIEGEKYPAVVSQYIAGEITGKVEFTHYIRTERLKNTKLFTFLQIVTLKKCDESLEDLNHIEISGVVGKTRGIVITRGAGMETLPFIVQYRSYDNNTNIIHCVARNQQARKLNFMVPKDIIDFTGQLKINKSTIEVLVKESSYTNTKKKVQ